MDESTPPIRVLIASDVRLYSEGIRQFLADRAPFEVVGIAVRPGDVLTAVQQLWPQVVLLDQALPASLEVLRGLRRTNPRGRVIALGVPDQEETLLAWAEAGVAGFVPREASVEDLLSTIESAIRGELHCSPHLAGTLLRRLAARAGTSRLTPPRSALTAREAEIIRLIDEGLANKEIAVRLGIELATVKNHVHNLLEKLRVHRRADAVARLRGRDPMRPTPPPIRTRD